MPILENELVKRAYLDHLLEARGMDEKTIVQVEVALAKFEDFLDGADFRIFDAEVAKEFKHYLRTHISRKTKKPLSISMVVKTLRQVSDFLVWLSGRNGYRSKIDPADIMYLSPTNHEVGVAKVQALIVKPTIQELYTVVEAMPSETILQRRDRAALALTILTGVRNGALITLKVKHLNVSEELLDQDPREVATKRSKHIRTWFFPVRPVVKDIVVEWHRELIRDCGFNENDPLFPATQQAQNDALTLEVVGLSRSHWAYANSFREVYRRACNHVGLPYTSPHHVRDALVALGMHLCRTPEEFKAFSQNLGHDDVLITFLSYGDVELTRQAHLIKGLRNVTPLSEDAPAIVALRQMALTLGYDLAPIRSLDGSVPPRR